LSAIHDKAFDKGLIALSDDFRVLISAELKRSENSFIQTVILPLDGRSIELPERFLPDANFVVRHRMEEFADSKSGK
jgi:predicted restriction endonuclease